MIGSILLILFINNFNFSSPCSQRKFFLRNLKMLFLSTTYARPQSVSREINFPIRLYNSFLTADRPNFCGIFGYRPTTSTVHKIMLAGDLGKKQSLFKNTDLHVKSTDIHKHLLLSSCHPFYSKKGKPYSQALFIQP